MLFGDCVLMSQSMNSSLLDYRSRFMTFMQNILRNLRQLSRSHSLHISELLVQVEEATTPPQLTKAVNMLQSQLWKLPMKEQAPLRGILVKALSMRVLHAFQTSLRLEAAGWLRLFVQAGLVTQPQDTFVTLVTATVRHAAIDKTTNLNEQRAYLKMIFDCFWPFRHPYAAYTWQVFPANEVFYPLVPLLDSADATTQDALMGIFAELPTLDDAEIVEHLLPIALTWSTHCDPERRRRVTNVLARISHVSTQEALRRLQSDPDPIVRASAKRAASYIRPA